MKIITALTSSSHARDTKCIGAVLRSLYLKAYGSDPEQFTPNARSFALRQSARRAKKDPRETRIARIFFNVRPLSAFLDTESGERSGRQ
jgi:hypothetical protein